MNLPDHHQQSPARRGPTAGGWIALGLGGGTLLIVGSAVAVALLIAVSIAAMSLAICALVIRSVVNDMRKDR